MADLSEQISELSAELLLKAIGELAQLAYTGTNLIRDLGQDAGAIARAQLIKLINASEDNREYDKKTQRAINKLEKAVLKDGSTPRQITILEQDRETTEKWLKKQNVTYVALKDKNQDCPPGKEKCMITFLEKDSTAMYIAGVLSAMERGLINDIPPQAYLFLNKEKDITVIDNLDIYELEVFRENAKDLGLVFSSMINGVDEETGEVYGDNPNTYKILCSKKDSNKLAAVMQLVSWSMTGEYKDGIKEKVKEKYSIKEEIELLLEKGIPEKNKFLIGKDGKNIAIENAKYIVNAKSPNEYLKITKDGFVHFKAGKEFNVVSKNSSDYYEKAQDILSGFAEAVIFDSFEWENEGLEKLNLRKSKVSEKLSVFPPKHEKVKENKELRKANKKHKKENKELEETAWLFDKFDAEKAFSEVVEINYNNDSEPLERNVSVHYEDARRYSNKYRYLDVVNDKETIDNIILSAKERSLGNDDFEIEVEKDFEV